MSLDTDFNKPPYFDDFNEEKNFHRILFKPVVAVQARELTQLQTILQNQIERFGNNVLQEGTIITGGNFVEINPLPYVKISDSNTSGDRVNVENLVGFYAVSGNSGLRALIQTALPGFESQTPDLNTLYVKYLNSGSAGQKTFNATENIEIQDENGTVLDTVTVGGTSDANPIGTGYGVRCGEGLIYQKGHFIRFEDNITVVSKYDTVPDNVVIGFQTNESVVTSDLDSSLLDNANGFPNENAPGADRLKLTPTLVTKTLEDAQDDESFYAIQEYQRGLVVRRRLTTQYNELLDLIEKRSVEQNGNFVVNRFSLRVEEDQDSDDLSLVVGPGLAYVEGKRVELVGDIDIQFPKATETESVENQDIVANYGSYVNCENLSGVFDINTFEQVNLEDNGGVVIGTANIRTLTKASDNSYRVYLFNVKMNSGNRFDDVRKITNSSASIDVILDSANNAVIRDFSFKKAVYPIGKSAVESIDLNSTEYRYRSSTETETTSTGVITVNLPSGDSWPYTVGQSLSSLQKNDLIVIADENVTPYSTGDVIDISDSNTVITPISSTQLEIQLDGTTAQHPDSNMNTVVYHYADRSVSAVNNKQVVTMYVKVDTSTHPNGAGGVYSLGVPDAFEIEGVWKGTTYSESNTNITNEFRLFANQKDTHYGLSYIAPRGSTSLSSGDKVLIKVKVFRQTSGTNTFFAVNSYPVDDVSDPLPANKIRTQDIPVYVTDDQERISLRDAVDLRPYAANNVVYATSIGDANTNPSDTLDFGDSKLFFIGPNESVELDFSYYLSRIDRLIIDEKGQFNIVSGDSSENPTPPSLPGKTLSPCLIKVRPFPSLPIATASREDREEYSVFVTRLDNDNYYPQDIRKIEDRVKNLENYTALSLLEKKATDLVIQDETGLDRFKSGILVDNFNDLSVADVRSSEYSASIDTAYKEIVPRFRGYPIDLKVAETSNVTDYGETALLDSINTPVISQSTATAERSCTTDFWVFNGNMEIFPEADMSTDYVRAPDLNIDIDLEQPFVEFTEALSEFVPLQRVSTDVVSRARRGNRRITVTETTSEQLEIGSQPETQEVGDFVRDVRFNPFLRSREIQVQIFGMRPNTELYFYFDKKSVFDSVAPGQLLNGQIVQSGEFGDSISSDANGVVRAIFRIPSETFYVGDRVLEVFDANLYNSKESASTYAEKVYRGFNISVSKASLTTTTRVPDFSVEEEVVSRNTRVRRVATGGFNPGGGPAGGGAGDPISQTFIIDENNSIDNIVYVSGVDVFFSSKSDTNGVKIEVREVNNGLPTGVIVPFSRVHLNPDEVTANNTTASNATTVNFRSPIPLKTGKEYALVVHPDANDPDYKVWISRTGETDVDTGLNVQQDTNAGVLFTSTNNKTWTPYQDENLKFTVYKSEFVANTGTLTLTNKDDEFLKLTNVSDSLFQENEYVFVDSSNNALSGVVTTQAGNNQITGIGTQFSNEYQEGEYIVVFDDTDLTTANVEVLQIDNIANNTVMTTRDIPKKSIVNENHFSTVVGKTSYYNNRDPKLLILSESSAKSGLLFASGDTIVGVDSKATAEIDSVDDLPISYMQTNILRVNSTNSTSRLRARRLFSPAIGSYGRTLKFNDNNYLYDNESYIRSRSNEIEFDSGSNSFELEVEYETNSPDSSTLIDYEASSVTLYEYFINNDSTNERTLYGNAESKYVTRKIELQDGLDGEDMRVLLTAYRPVGSDVEVWVKFQSATDPNVFEDCTCVAWTKLEKKAETDVRSSSANRFDLKEIEYVLGEEPLGDGEGAYLQNGDTFTYTDEDGAVYNSFKFFAVKIVFKSNSHNVIPRVRDMRAIALS